MVALTLELIRSKAEHHDGLLSELEELSLHQLQIEKIESVSAVCPRLKILYLQNNLISKIDGLRRLSELRYLNLALNNITSISGLEQCHALSKLDLTVNFVSLSALRPSLMNLRDNERLSELFVHRIGTLVSKSLTRTANRRFLQGNPCTEWQYYRQMVVHLLPNLESLDGQKVTITERLWSDQHWSVIEEDYVKCSDEEKPLNFTPEQRYEMVRSDAENRSTKTSSGVLIRDPLQRAQLRMNRWIRDTIALPRQRNMAKISWRLDDEDSEVIRVVALIPKHIMSTRVFCQVEPKWMQLLIDAKQRSPDEREAHQHRREKRQKNVTIDDSKRDSDSDTDSDDEYEGGNLFVCHFPCDVISSRAQAARSQTTGEMTITIPRVQVVQSRQANSRAATEQPLIKIYTSATANRAESDRVADWNNALENRVPCRPGEQVSFSQVGVRVHEADIQVEELQSQRQEEQQRRWQQKLQQSESVGESSDEDDMPPPLETVQM